MPVILVVAGGRGYYRARRVNTVCSAIEQMAGGISMLFNGGQTGADQLSSEWWHSKKYPVECLRIFSVSQTDWSRYGRAAGPLRNVEMLRAAQKAANELFEPLCVAVFEGGRGTEHCRRLAETMGCIVVDADRFATQMDEVGIVRSRIRHALEGAS